MSSHRQLSPGGRRIQNPGRVSDGVTDPYRYERHNSYTSPRSSGGVIPISTQTFVNIPPPTVTSATRPTQRYDSYSGRPTDAPSGRPRRSSLVDTSRGSVSSVSQVPSRARPTVIQSDAARPSSPQKSNREKEYYVTPGTSKEPRKTEHKKLYSVNDGSASLVADVNIPAGGERHHRRRESDGGERGGYRGSGPEKDRGRRSYHANGPSKPKEKSIEDDDAYSYTDPAAMYRDTEPRWREREVRPRRGSVDRGGASRERPVSMIDRSFDPRQSNKEIGPPPSTRGWDKINDGLGRARSVRDRPRDVAQSPTRARVPQSPTRARGPQSPNRGRYAEPGAYGDPRDPYYVPPRTTSTERRNTAARQDRPVERYDQYEYEERREPRRHERRNSVTRAPDPSVERRGFGIRSESQDRYARGSDESFERQNKYRDSGYAVPEPHRRETVPDVNYQDERRFEQERRDRAVPDRLPNDERERQWDREAREKEPRRREDDRGYDREYDRDRELQRQRDREFDMDRERERERERMMQPQPEPERQTHRQDSIRDRDVGRKENSPRQSGEALSQPGLGTAAAGGLAGVAAAYGLSKAHDREKERDREVDPRYEKPREPDRIRLSPRPQDNRSQDTHSDEGLPFQQERDRHRAPERERGLGFAFENPPEPPRTAPPMRERQEHPPAQDRVEERDFERQHEDKQVHMAPQQPILDPEEDYRRRMEQVQRELGRGSDDRTHDPDPDRERRRREREQRQRERMDGRNSEPSVVGSHSSFSEVPPPSQLRHSFENESVDGTNSTTSRPGLNRKPSILDEPMTNEPSQMAQIIDNSMSEKRENRVRIVDPPTEQEERKPKGILKQPKPKFPEYPNAMREGVAPLKDATKSGIPPGARWTKIDRRLVNPEALEEAKERFEERLECVIVLRVLTKEEIQKLADRTRELRDERYEEERVERKAARRRDRNHDRHDRDEYELENSEDEFKPKAPKMLEAPSTASGAPSSDSADFVRDNRDRRREREGDREQQYTSGGAGRRDDGYDR